MDSTPGIITQCLREWRDGDEAALARLTDAVYRELRRLAGAVMSGQAAGRTLQPTVLVHELYFQLPGIRHFDWQSRAQFLGVAARLMRHVLVDHAREQCREKRGGGAHLLPLDEGLAISPAKSAELVALDDALHDLARFDPRKAQVVELRYFGGVSVEEAAEAVGVHPNTVISDWSLAKAWLKRELSPRSANGA